VQVQSLTGDCHRARHLACARGGPPRPQAQHRGYLLRSSSRKCQVRLHDRRPRHRRHPSRLRSHSTRSQLPTRWTLPVKSFYEYVSSSYPPSLTRATATSLNSNVERLQLSLAKRRERPPLCRIFGASLGVTAVFAFSPNCACRRVSKEYGTFACRGGNDTTAAPYVRIAGCRSPATLLLSVLTCPCRMFKLERIDGEAHPRLARREHAPTLWASRGSVAGVMRNRRFA
jgi:hypothetical protein